MKKIYFRLKGDRKFFADNVKQVVTHAFANSKITTVQANELLEFGISQDGKFEIVQFASK